MTHAMLKIFAKKFLLFLVVLSFVISYISVIQFQNDTALPLNRFQPSMSSDERADLMDLLKRLVRGVEEANITYFMYGGTLLGSYRHHGFIPWDDDIDLLIDFRDKDKLLQVIKDMAPTYDVWTELGPRIFILKFFYSARRHIIPLWKPYSYPFIDIFFYLNNDTHTSGT